jgi:8-oxo-dGTP pyrophosphatase MutT (NUDIX family)
MVAPTTSTSTLGGRGTWYKNHGNGVGSTSRARILVVSILLMAILLVSWTWVKTLSSPSIISNKNKYRGKQYWNPGVTRSVQTLYETPFARFQIHQVQPQGSTTSASVIKDWLWFDESDNVNVLVEDDSQRFWVLEQTKYAIPEKTYAVVGGLIEANESPLQAAQRELKEELQLESTDWISLGSYVAAANRGGGTTHTFWARNSKPSGKRHNPNRGGGVVIAEGELERQDVVQLSRQELLQAVTTGRFKEIKWTATVALALLVQQQQPANVNDKAGNQS